MLSGIPRSCLVKPARGLRQSPIETIGSLNSTNPPGLVHL